MNPTGDLFDSPDTPGPAAQLRYLDAWLVAAKGRAGPLARESASVYRDIWSAYVTWCVSRGLHTAEASAEDLEAYLAYLPRSERLRGRPGVAKQSGPVRRTRGDELDPRYAWRVVHLIERVLHHRARQLGQEPTKAVAALLANRPDIKYANATQRDKLPEYLDGAEARSLVAHLMAPARPTGAWQTLRNRTAVALHLGAGLTPLEVRELRLDGVRGRGTGIRRLRVPESGTVPEHEAPAAPWCWRIVDAWLQHRTQIGIQGNYALPAGRTGKAWSKTAHYEAVGQVLEEVGLQAQGAYALRHTFALRQLRRGRTHAEVAQWLGVDEAATSRYRRVLQDHVVVV